MLCLMESGLMAMHVLAAMDHLNKGVRNEKEPVSSI